MSLKSWERYVNRLPLTDKLELLYIAIQKLIEIDEVRFQHDDYIDKTGRILSEDEILEEHLYWTSSSKDLLDKNNKS